MKIFLSCFLGVLTISSSLLAQSAKITSADSELSLQQYSNINGCQSKLMMDSGELKNIEKGIEVFGLSEKTVSQFKTASDTAASTRFSIENKAGAKENPVNNAREAGEIATGSTIITYFNIADVKEEPNSSVSSDIFHQVLSEGENNMTTSSVTGNLQQMPMVTSGNNDDGNSNKKNTGSDNKVKKFRSHAGFTPRGTASSGREVELILQNGYLLPVQGGGFYDEIEYSEHALERMAERTLENIQTILDHCIQRAERDNSPFASLKIVNNLKQYYKVVRTDENQKEHMEPFWRENCPANSAEASFQNYWKKKGLPDPRGISPDDVKSLVMLCKTNNPDIRQEDLQDDDGKPNGQVLIYKKLSSSDPMAKNVLEVAIVKNSLNKIPVVVTAFIRDKTKDFQDQEVEEENLKKQEEEKQAIAIQIDDLEKQAKKYRNNAVNKIQEANRKASDANLQNIVPDDVLQNLAKSDIQNNIYLEVYIDQICDDNSNFTDQELLLLTIKLLTESNKLLAQANDSYYQADRLRKTANDDLNDMPASIEYYMDNNNNSSSFSSWIKSDHNYEYDDW